MADQSLILTFEPSESKYTYGKAYTKRETLKERCSLHINNLTMQDNGFYSVLKQKGENKASEIGKVFLLIAGKCPVSLFLPHVFQTSET